MVGIAEARRILIQTGKSVSLNEVARQIGYVGEQLGYSIILNRDYPQFWNLKRVCDALMLIYTPSPTYSTKFFLAYRDALKIHHVGALYYTTTEGPPKSYLIPDWVRRELEFVANSQYTKVCLEKAGLKVKDVVLHGVLWCEVQQAEKEAPKYKKLLDSQFKDKVKIACVTDDNVRKGLDALIEAVDILSAKRDDFVVLLLTKKTVMRKIKDKKNIVFVGEFGTRSHVEVLAFMHACDFLVFPSQAEGFGLPVLEAMAMARPAIHCMLPPFREYVDPKANFWFEASDIVDFDSMEGIIYELHSYDPKDLAVALEDAIECKLKRSSEYADRCTKAREAASKLKAEELYKKLYELIRWKPLVI